MSFYIVIGCHRSGTSLLAGLLHHSGINMGKGHFRPKPNTGNPKGYFEDIRYRKINDSILESSGYEVKLWSTVVPTIRANKSLRQRIRMLLWEVTNNSGAKDPRFCLTWQVWQQHLPEDTKVYFTYRHPEAVANSLQKRNGITKETALDLWNIYNQRALGIAEIFDTVFVSYEDLLAEGSEKVLGVDDTKNLIDPRLNHSSALETTNIPQSCREIWSTLKNSN